MIPPWPHPYRNEELDPWGCVGILAALGYIVLMVWLLQGAS